MRLCVLTLLGCAACGGGDSSTNDGGQDGTLTDVTGGGDVAMMDGSGMDTGQDGMMMMGSDASISCGSKTCTGLEFCCVRSADGGVAYSCETIANACNGGGILRCDDRTDCMMGEVCCYEVMGNIISARCHGDCAGGGGSRYQACKTTQECLADAGPCTTHGCDGGGSVQSCKPIPNLCP